MICVGTCMRKDYWMKARRAIEQFREIFQRKQIVNRQETIYRSSFSASRGVRRSIYPESCPDVPNWVRNSRKLLQRFHCADKIVARRLCARNFTIIG